MPFALAVAPLMIAEGFASMLYAVNDAGGDTDTIGSIAGQIAGAHVGGERSPWKFLRLYPWRQQKS